MDSVTIQQLCDITGGTLVGRADFAATVTGCSIDSRSVRPGDAFFALFGEQHHGVSFAQSAVSSGAAIVVADDTAQGAITFPHIAVPDCAEALAQIAASNRENSEALVIGVTGSVGKTTTRMMIDSVLKARHWGVQSPSNFNNHLGVPLTLLQLNGDHEYAVVEIGTSMPGEIRQLTQIAQPEFGVLTRISAAHLRGLRTVKDVRREKQQLLNLLPEEGIAFLNADDPLVLELEDEIQARTVLFGSHPDADVRVSEFQCTQDSLTALIDGVEYQISACGSHHLSAMAAAVAIGLEVGLSAREIQQGLNLFRPARGRSQLLQGLSGPVIDDTYNASPASVQAAISTLENFPGQNRRIMVLSDMLDLGQQAVTLHEEAGALLASSQIDHILLSGEYAETTVESFLESGGHQNRVSVFHDIGQLTTILEIIAGEGDVVLVKGSRATRMECVVDFLRPQTDAQETRRAA